MSLLSAILIGVTSMVGSGWLFSTQLTAKTAGNCVFLAWILAAIMIMMVGLCLVKVVSVFPVRGATTTRSSALLHNSVFAMPFAFANWFGNNFNVRNALIAIVTGGLVYTFNGFQIVVAYSSKINNPSRNVPLAIILSLAL